MVSLSRKLRRHPGGIQRCRLSRDKITVVKLRLFSCYTSPKVVGRQENRSFFCSFVKFL